MDGLTDRMVPRGSMTTIPSTAAFSAASNQRASPSVPLKAGGRPAPPLVSSSVELIGEDHNPAGKDIKDIKDIRDTKVPPSLAGEACRVGAVRRMPEAPCVAALLRQAGLTAARAATQGRPYRI